jgi:hypothetical protein
MQRVTREQVATLRHWNRSVRQNTTGGSGASFLVQWFAKESVSDPVIETVMIDTSSQQGISFVRTGHVLSEVPTKGSDEVQEATQE